MSWALLRIEFVVCAWIIVLLLGDLLVPPPRKASLWKLALAGAVACGVVLGLTPIEWIGHRFQDMFVLDRFALYFKSLSLLTVGLVIIMTRHLTASGRPSTRLRLAQDDPQQALSVKTEARLEGSLPHPGAFYMLLFTALLGMLVLASVQDLLLLFIGLELLTFSLYIMAAYLKTEPQAIEAGMKYLILGSVSAGFLVYGISLLYGFAGDTSFRVLQAAIAKGPVPWTAQAGLLLIVAALGFKVAMFPFHLWVPDVYQGAPTPVVALLSVGSKIAGVAAMLRVLFGVFMPLEGLWADVLAGLAAATMLYGNLGAIPQTNIKRLLGYSSIGHAGYLMMGISTASSAGAQAVGFYALAYLLSNSAVFLVIASAASAVGGDSLEAYNGLSRRSPLLAAVLFVGLLSLAGVPPLAGFVGKLLVLLATMDSGRLWLVMIGALNVVVSLYYYLMVIRRAYLLAPSSSQPIVLDGLTRLTLLALCAAILIIGVVQQPFLEQVGLALRP